MAGNLFYVALAFTGLSLAAAAWFLATDRL
jgi:hypothetical protein